jgi:hypothetical protein
VDVVPLLEAEAAVRPVVVLLVAQEVVVAIAVRLHRSSAALAAAAVLLPDVVSLRLRSQPLLCSIRAIVNTKNMRAPQTNGAHPWAKRRSAPRAREETFVRAKTTSTTTESTFAIPTVAVTWMTSMSTQNFLRWL